MYNDSNQNPLEGHNPNSIPVVAARKPVLTMDALNWIKSNPKEKEAAKEKEKTFFEQLQAKMMQFEMEKLLAQMQQQRLQQPSNQVAKFKLGGTTGGTSVEEVKKVKAIQAKLKAAGFYNGKVDGAWGPKTQEAYTAFEDASNAGCEGEDCNDPFSEGPGSTQAHNGMYNNPPDVNKGAGVIAEMLTGAGLPDNVSFMLTHLLTGNSVVPTGDTQGYGYPNQRTQLELYRAIQNNEKAGKTKPSKTGKRGISYEDYSADIAKKALNNSELDVLTLLGGSLLSDTFNAATTYGQVSYDRDPKDPHIIRVYDNYDFNGKRDAREGENLYRKVRRGVGNTSAILNKENINKAQYIGSYDTRVWDKISELGIDPNSPTPFGFLPRINSTEYPTFAYGGKVQQYRDGGKVVKEVDSLTPAERKWYLENGYDIEEDGVMEYAKGGPVNGDNTIPDSFYIESNVLPVVEIKGKRRAGSSTVSLTPSDQPTNSEFKKKDNIKENLKWLAMLTADTATDQIPNSEHVKMAYDGYKGNPITGLMNYAKIPAPIILDMLINMIQNNPTGIDTEHLDGYFKGQFKDKSLSNKVSNQYAKGGKVQSYKGGGKINPDEVVTFGEYKNVPFGMLSPEAQQEYKDSKSREIATGVKTEKSSSTRTDIKAGSTEHNVHVSAFPNPDKPLKEHGNPKTTKALRTLSGVDKNELQKSLAVDDLDLLYTLEQEFANNPAYNYSWYHKSKDIWPSAHVPTKQDTVNYNAMLGAVNDYGSKDYHVNDSSYTPTTGDVIRSILGYPAVEHSNGMSIQDMSMLPAELAHRYQQNNGLLNTQRFLTDVVTKGGLGMNYRALYDDATSFEGEAHSLIEPVLKEEFSVRQAREKLRLDGAKIVPTSDEDLVEQSRKTIQKVLSQYAKGGKVKNYKGGGGVNDPLKDVMIGGIPFYLAPVEAQNKYLQTMLPSPTLPNDNWVYKEQDKTPSKTKDFTAAQDNTRVDIKTSKKIPYKKPDLLPTDKEFAEQNQRYDDNAIPRIFETPGFNVGNLANNLFNAAAVVDGAMLGNQLLKYGIKKALTSYGKEAFTPDLNDIGTVLNSTSKQIDMPVASNTWRMEELPGLHLSSTMEGGAISKIVEPKTGLINTEQALAIIGKESGGADKVALIRQGLGDKLPKKMDFNEFRKVVQKQLIPLERQFASDRSNYGIHSLGYPMPKRSSFESAVFHAEKDIADLQSKIQEASKLERVFIDGTPAYRFKGRYGEELFRSKDEALFAQKKAISDMTESLEISNSNLKTTQATMKNLPLENQTLILGNKSKLGKGSNAHGNPDETLGHIHFLRDKESPDVLTVTQIQSDAFQGTHRIPMKQEAESLRRLKELKEGSLYNYNNTLDYYKELFENAKLKTRPDGSKHYGLFDKNGEVIDFISEAEFKKGHKYYTDKVFNFEDMLQYSDEISSKTQKQLLDKNHQERYLQELVDYAGKRGDVNKVRVPTDRTAAKIQGYSKDYTHAHPPDRDTHEVLSVIEDWRNKGKSIEDVISIFEKEIAYRKLTPEEVKEVTSLYKLNAKGVYSTEQQTILKKYSEQPKTIKKLFGKEPTIVTDSKGNTWYEFDIPDKFKKGKGEIKAFSIAPYALPTLGATGVAAAASQDKKNK